MNAMKIRVIKEREHFPNHGKIGDIHFTDRDKITIIDGTPYGPIYKDMGNNCILIEGDLSRYTCVF